jgi:anti-sigma factor RsiW
MNPNDKLNDEMLTAYFDGELSQAEQVQVEQALFDNAEYARRLRQWSQLRDAVQQASEVIQARVVAASNITNGSESNELEAMVMKRITAATAAGEVKWLKDGSMSPAPSAAVSATADSVTVGMRAAAEIVDSKHAVGPDSHELSEWKASGSSTNKNGGGWLADYRQLDPAQRLRRWQWQLGAIATVAAGLLLTVYLIPNREGDGAFLALPKAERRFPGATMEKQADAPMSVAAGETLPMAAGEAMASVSVDPMSATKELAGAVLGTAMEAGGQTDSAPAYAYTTFMSYDVANTEVGLQQMQAVLAQNSVIPTDVFEQDESSIVVLSGDAKKLAEILESFQAAGDHSLALVAKVGPEFEVSPGGMVGSFGSPMLQNLGDTNTLPDSTNTLPVAPQPAVGPLETPIADTLPIESTNQSSKLMAAAPAPNVASAVEPQAAQARGGVDGDLNQSFPSSPIAGNTAVANGSMATLNVYRQDVIRTQANVISNSMTPSPNVTLEQFLNERPAPRRPRVPFPGQANQISADVLSDNPALSTERGSESAFSTAAESPTQATEIGPAAEAIVGRQRRQDSAQNRVDGQGGMDSAMDDSQPGHRLERRSLPQQDSNVSASPPGSGEVANPTEVNAMTMQNSPATQLVIILRPKSRNQQAPQQTPSQNQ